MRAYLYGNVHTYVCACECFVAVRTDLYMAQLFTINVTEHVQETN